MLGAGPRALLLQLAHPAVAAGVDQHSDFRVDPWARLAATLRSYLTIVFGPTAAARGEIRRLNALHRAISGPGYTARDPELSLWVHATLIDLTMVANDAWLGGLSTERRSSFYAETRPIGRAFGVPDRLLPSDLRSFQAYVAGMLAPDGPVHVSTLARELAQSVLRPPLAPLGPLVAGLPLGRWLAHSLPRFPPDTYAWTLWPAVGLLPPQVRGEYRLAWGGRERLVSGWLVTGWRAWRPLIPASLRQMPMALAADRRMAGRRDPAAPGNITSARRTCRRPNRRAQPAPGGQ